MTIRKWNITKILLWSALLIIVTFVILVMIIGSRYLRSVKASYHKEWVARFIETYHAKTNQWPRSWTDLESQVDTSSPFPYAEIKSSVTVKWENLGRPIDLATDYYLRTEPNAHWRGKEQNQRLLRIFRGEAADLEPRPLREGFGSPP